MAGVQASTSDIKRSNDNGNGLLLYQFYPSYYCQKVVFCLYEKKLKFKSQIIDLFRGEQLEPSFLKINPKGEVPVLKDGVKIIPDSRRIIDYVEDNFSNGSTPRLIPEKGSISYQTMERMRELLDNIPVSLITFGCIMNPSLTGKMLLSQEEIKFRQAYYTNHETRLNDYSVKYPEFRDHYGVKLSALQRNRANVLNVSEVEKGFLDAEYALKEVEKILATHKEDQKNWWLCCEKFTIADISLSLLLNRIHVLGLSERFFKNNELPHVQEYFKRVQQRESFKKTVNQTSGILKTICCLERNDQMLTLGSLIMVLCAAGVAAFLIHRKK